MTGAIRRRPPRLVAMVFGVHAEYVWGLAPLFLLCALLFVFSLGVGFDMGKRLPRGMIEEIAGALPDLRGLNPLALFLFVASNNLLKSFIWMMLGLILGAPPIFFTVINGFVIGWVSFGYASRMGPLLTAASLAPHGVIEIPAILLSMAAGMGLGYQLIRSLRGRGSLRSELGMAVRLFMGRIAPMLLVASGMEVAVTPALVRLFAG